jgi:YD repeat-containing protein
MANLKSITIIRTNIIPVSGGSLDSHRIQRFEFDDQGREVKQINYDHYHQEDDSIEYRYAADGRKSAEVFSQGGEVLESKYFLYDAGGRVVSERKEYMAGNIDTIECVYDEHNRLSVRRLKDDEGDIETSETFEYENGLLIRQAVFDGNDNLISEDLFEYNEKNDLASLLRRNTLDEEEHREVTEYDEKGRKEVIKQYNAAGNLVERTRYSYDENDRVSLQEDEDGHRHSFISFFYDEKGSVVLQEEHNENDELVSRISRTFDEEGKQLSSEVLITNSNYRIPQHYTVTYRYETYS